MNVSRSEDLPVIPSRHILEKIEKGEIVRYKNIIILGDLNPKGGNSGLPYNISSPIEIENSKIYGNLNFDNAQMQASVNFENTAIFGTSSFNNTQFLDDTSFMNTIFDADALFLGALCKSNVNFKRAIFNGSAVFWKARFEGKTVDFARSQFRKDAYFMDVQFDDEYVSFQESRFYGAALFLRIRSFGRSDFSGARFDKLADFSFSRLDESSDFVGSRFNDKIILNGIKFGLLIITWDSLKNKVVCNGPIYMDLIKNFRDLEQFDDADSCYYQYRDWRRVNRPLEWAKIADYIAWLSCGYGVRWQHTILSGIFIVALFGIYFESNYIARATANIFLKRNAKNQNPGIANLWISIKKSVSFSAMTLLSLPSDWFPYGKEEYSKLVKSHLYAAILERLIGWGLMLLLIGTLTRLMVRY